MFALFIPPFALFSTRTAAAPEPQCKRTQPLFIGDAVQPFGQETVLLHLLREEQRAKDDD